MCAARQMLRPRVFPEILKSLLRRRVSALHRARPSFAPLASVRLHCRMSHPSSGPSGSRPGVWGASQHPTALFSGQAPIAPTGFAAAVGPVGGPTGPRNIWGQGSSISVSEIFGRPAVGGDSLGQATSSGLLGFGAPISLPPQTAVTTPLPVPTPIIADSSKVAAAAPQNKGEL